MVVVAGVVVHDNRIMIARRSSAKSNAGLWEFPGGKVDHGENDQDALTREFTEEFGMSIIPRNFLGTFQFYSPTLSIELRVWFAKMKTKPVHSTDHDMIEWVSAKQLSEYTFSPADIPAVERIIAGDWII